MNDRLSPVADPHRLAAADCLVALREPADARVRLLLFHYAGGAAAVFQPWLAELPDDVAVTAFQLPGRRPGRETELLRHVGDVVDLAGASVRALLDRPTVVFGHSIGALIAFEMLRAACAGAQGLPPCHLVVSARRAPHLPPTGLDLHALSDERFIDCLKSYDGTPAAVLRDDALMALFLPRLRADFAISETYRHAPGPLLDCPITALACDRDSEAPMRSVFDWRYQTTGAFRFVRMGGGHFFIHEHQHAVVAILSELLSALLSDLPGTPPREQP